MRDGQWRRCRATFGSTVDVSPCFLVVLGAVTPGVPVIPAHLDWPGKTMVKER